VTLLSNVPRTHTSQGATFLPLSKRDLPREVDVLILTTSGDKLSLESALSLPVQARLREVWVHGTIPVQGLEALDPDRVVAVSNFIRGVAVSDWGVPEGKTAVIHNGYTPYPEDEGDLPPVRDPYALIYTSHPSKGMETAISVTRLLRRKDERFQLHVYGGGGLWGGEDKAPEEEPGVVYHGLVGQREVVRALQEAGFSLHLQARLEPFALSLVEAMGYGCIPIVSPLGGNREAVRHGVNGFWVVGDHRSPEVQTAAADLIYTLVQTPTFIDHLRRNARMIPWTWENQARVWTAHFAHLLEGKGAVLEDPHTRCPECGGKWLLTADGYHCTTCGLYALDLVQE
jgi:glycosyltransferase involved in cell wall biosynthesis